MLAPVSINTDIATPQSIPDSTTTFDYTFKLKAIAEGGATAVKEVSASIVVCRYEELTPVDASTLTVSLSISPNTVASSIDLTQMF
jgi:hypothetical protein